ncbi:MULTISPECIES: acyltransferase family protein [Chryseobacterium]|uniref:Peptidoglycan/LPS O-acetylase OafA/YrhL n=1 Tax=Chryseobacterium geocarposphaerae TaxID=1416776 RepID=A0ABU1LDF4_9FLAO|nr:MULTISPECIES: acyltransferase family protein [Chryseobacterium]MDR6404580.1 peptidoglycan/LPS O-acetylase OafA/YrhL [Chryseobacterium geocarposphaerae]MDR6698188.1 peptidoglycan/LPS O-acetylase OafA/YrhL [Chryseobacterium ginsenosidimutans]
MKFRADISFLRAISVLAVLLYHYKISALKGGFIGVDIFFVISGYLMTKIILTGIKNDNFHILDFYKKRVIRIFPALLCTITFFAVVIYILIPTQFISYMKLFSSSSLFFSNIYYYLNSGYFDISSQYNFLLHTWSLSVEWQFYMIYPIILLVFKKMYKTNENKFKLYFFGLIIISFSSMLLHNTSNKPLSFYMFYPRAWEMMFGGLAFLFEKQMKSINKNIKVAVVIFSLVTIVFFLSFVNEKSIAWPSNVTIIPVVLTTLILLFNVDIKLFNNKIVKFIGDISYSLYLWHWPFYVLSLYFAVNGRLRYRLTFIFLSLIFSILTYYFIEKKNYYKQYKMVLGTALVLFIISFSLSQTNSEYILTTDNAKLADAATNYKYSDDAYAQYSLFNKHFSATYSLKDYNLANLKLSDQKNIILLGDSHAAMFSKTLKGLLKNSNYSLIQATADATYPMTNAQGFYKGPKDFFNYFYNIYYPKNYKKISLIVICSNYSGYDKEDLIKNINFTEGYFQKFQTPVIYLGQTDMYSMDYPTHYYLDTNYNIQNKEDNALKYKTHKTNKYLKERLGSKYIDLLGRKILKITQNGTPYMYDSNHLTYAGSEQYKSLIYNSLKCIK